MWRDPRYGAKGMDRIASKQQCFCNFSILLYSCSYVSFRRAIALVLAATTTRSALQRRLPLVLRVRRQHAASPSFVKNSRPRP